MRSPAILVVPALLGLAACNAQEAEVDGLQDSAEGAVPDAGPAISDEGDPGNGDPDKADDSQLALAETAWRVIGEDGAIYTTLLDADGTYRDLRNGDALQSGEWERKEDGRLCFTPEAEDRSGECWELGEQDKDGKLRATDSNDRAVELRQVTYIAPAEI